MSKVRRISLDWERLFAFEQAEDGRRSARDSRLVSRLGEKVGGKSCLRIPQHLDAKIGGKSD